MLVKDKVSSPPKTSETVIVMIHTTPSRLLFIRRVRIVAKRAYYVMTANPHEYARIPWGGFPRNCTVGTSLNICRENLNLVKIEQKYRAFYFRPKNGLLLPVTPNRHKNALFERYGTRLLQLPRRYKHKVTNHGVTLYVQSILEEVRLLGRLLDSGSHSETPFPR